MPTYNDDALCLCPELVEKMSKEYFSALHDCGVKIVSLSSSNSMFFERHVKELSQNFSMLSCFYNSRFAKSETLLQDNQNPFEHYSSQILEMFGLENCKAECTSSCMVKESALPNIYANIFSLELLMLRNFEGNECYASCMQFCMQSCSCLKALSIKLCIKP